MRSTPRTTAPRSTPAPTEPSPSGAEGSGAPRLRGAPETRAATAWALSLGVVATALALVAGTVYELWYDEAASISAATRSWFDFARLLGVVDAVHALHYTVSRLSLEVLGVSAFALRLPSALAVGATTALLVPLGARLSGRSGGALRSGVLAALVFLALPRTLWIGAEGRGFALATLAVTALTLVLLIAREQRSRRWWIAYAAIAAAAVGFFAYSAIVVIGHALFVLLRGPGAHPAGRLRFIVAAGAGAVAVSPLALLAVRQRGQLSWLPPINPGTFGEVLAGQWFGGGFSWPVPEAARWTAVLLAAALLCGAVVLLRRRDGSAALLLPLLVLPTALVLLASLRTPLYTGRYLTFCLPFVALAIAVGIAALPRRPLRIAAVAVVVALGIGALAANVAAPHPSPWSRAAAWIAEDRADAPAAVLHGRLDYPAGFRTDVIATAYPAAFAGLEDATVDRSAAETAWLWDERVPLDEGPARLGDVDRVYLLGAEQPGELDGVLARLTEQGWQQTAVLEGDRVVVRRFER